MKIRSLIKESCQCICSNFKTMAPAYFLVALLDLGVLIKTNGYSLYGSNWDLGLIFLNVFICFLVYTNMLHFSFKGIPTNLFTFHRFDLVRRGLFAFGGLLALMIIPVLILAFAGEYGQSLLSTIDHEYGKMVTFWGTIIIGGFLGIYFVSKYSLVIPLAIVDGGETWNKAVQLTKGFRWKIAGFKVIVILLMFLALAIKAVPSPIDSDIGHPLVLAVLWSFSTFCLLMIWTTADIVLLRNVRGI